MLITMFRFPKLIRAQLRHFAEDMRGTATVEAAIILPVLAAWFVGAYAFFDAFYSRSAATKAAYTVGDVLSRRTEAANPSVIDSLADLYDRLSPADGGTAIRVSNIEWDGTSHDVLWSHGTSAKLATLDNNQFVLGNYDTRLPEMYIGETVIVVEAFSAYQQPFNVGWNDNEFVFEEFVVTSPRYATKLAWEP